MAGKANQADFAATVPWAGVIGKPETFTPSKHAASHAATGDDPVALAISQIVGLANELAAKANSAVRINGHPLTGNVTLTKGDIGLGQVDNTSDMNKPVSIPQQAYIADAIAFAIPSGLIATWSGLLADIPFAWVLCDGNNGTPDLRDKFIKGCADGVDPGVTGGAELHTPTGTNDNEDAHTHEVTAAGTNATESAHTHGVTTNVTVADHASHTHTYTDVPNHVHVQTTNNATTGATGAGVGAAVDASTSGGPTTCWFSTLSNTGGVATGTTNGPNATLTHSVTNNAVTSGAGSAHTHTFTGSAVTSAAGSAHTHVFVGDEADYQPAFYTLAFIMKR